MDKTLSVPPSHLPEGGTPGQPKFTSLFAAPLEREVSDMDGYLSIERGYGCFRRLAGSKPCFRFTQTACPAGLKTAHEVCHANA